MNTTPTGPNVDAYGRAVPPQTAEQVATIQTMLKEVSTAKNQVKSLDMSNDTHRQFVLDRLGGEEYLERYFPSTRNLVETARIAHAASGAPTALTLLEMDHPATEEWHPLVEIAYLGLEPDGVRVIAQGIVSLPDWAASMTSNLALVNTATGDVFASVTVPNQYNRGTQVTDVTGILPPSVPPENVKAVLTTHYLEAGATLSKQVTASANLVNTLQSAVEAKAVDNEEKTATPIQRINVANPNHNNHPYRDFIKVGLNRTPNQVADCDYYYQYVNEGLKPIVGLLVNGDATLISGYTVAANPNFSGSCVLIRQSSSGDGATLAFPSDQIPQLCNGAGNAVNWDIGPDWLKGAPWDQGDTVDLDFTLTFAVKPSGTATLRVTSVPQGVTTPPNNIATVALLKFVWGCVAVGTLVRMEDGGLRRIETLKAGERVADGCGGSQRIAEVWKGHEDKPLYRLATASGVEALVTDGHPVLTPEGVAAAGELAPGMTVYTSRGEETLCAVEQVSHDGHVFNLELLPDGAETLTDIDDDTVTAFEANGLLVGDNRMQGVLARRVMEIPGPDPLDVLGQDWRLDITNSRRLQAGLPPIERVSAS
ncbi:MAG: hypothetical protein E4H19_11430 [Chromatiales bacterium]|nr:MAG: hypothetical protein E4H19_11430 [Chromatiales bacterium]